MFIKKEGYKTIVILHNDEDPLKRTASSFCINKEEYKKLLLFMEKELREEIMVQEHKRNDEN